MKKIIYYIILIIIFISGFYIGWNISKKYIIPFFHFPKVHAAFTTTCSGKECHPTIFDCDEDGDSLTDTITHESGECTDINPTASPSATIEPLSPTATPSAIPTAIPTIPPAGHGDGLSDGKSDGRSDGKLSTSQPTLVPCSPTTCGWK